MAARKKRAPAKPRARAKPTGKVRRPGWTRKLADAMPVSEAGVQKGLTVGLVGVFLLGAYSLAHYSGIIERAGDDMADRVAAAGFRVDSVEVTGIERIDLLKVYEITLAQHDRSMLDLDLDQLRADLVTNGWIKEARVSRRLPDRLIVDIEEREPAAIWQHRGKLSLIDRTGVPLERIPPEEAPDLPIIIGERANLKTRDLDRLLDSAPALRPLVTSASWIGNRRWNLEFDSGETLALPEGREPAAAALLTFARLDGVNRLLGRGVVHFDLRDDERAYIRMPPKVSQTREEPEG